MLAGDTGRYDATCWLETQADTTLHVGWRQADTTLHAGWRHRPTRRYMLAGDRPTRRYMLAKGVANMAEGTVRTDSVSQSSELPLVNQCVIYNYWSGAFSE
jgi:hypothetical protein